MTKRDVPGWLHWSLWPRSIGTNYPTDGGIVTECFEDDGIFTFRTTRGEFQCTRGENGKFTGLDGSEYNMLPPNDE